jgi:pentatricopeptide repeat protein
MYSKMSHAQIPTNEVMNSNDGIEGAAVESTEKRANEHDDEGGATLSEPPTKKQKQQPKKKISPQVLKTRRRIQQCCKINDLATAMEIYDESVSNNVTIEAQSFYNLLNLCDGLSDRGVHIGTPRPYKTLPSTEPPPVVRTVTAETRQQHAFRIKQDMDQRKLALNETAYTALVRMLSKAKRVEEAEDLLLEGETVQQCKPRLRLYSSLLCAYCEMDEMKKALNVWKRLDEKELALTEREYAALMQCATTTGNARIMNRILSDLAEDVLVPSHDTTRVIAEWFSSPHATIADGHATEGTHSTTQSDYQLPVSDAPDMGPVQVQGTGWMATSACTVDAETGILTSGCLKGSSLHPVALSDDQWNEMKNMNETIVKNGMLENDKSMYQGGGKGKKRHPSKQQGGVERRQSNWKQFQDYLNQRQHFDIVIDGANVGYYKQNFANAPKHVDYRQIDLLLQKFRSENKTILLVMHERHFNPKLMPSWAVPIVESWNSVLYRTPSGMNDDWFWLHAALWSGRQTRVVTNDEMRDHYFQMLAPRSFLRWKERHQIHFHFEFKNGQREVELVYPERYSRRIQRVANNGLVVPLPKQGDEHRYLDGTHVANDDHPEEETYLCIRPK